MKPFKVNLQVMELLGICSFDKSLVQWKKNRNISILIVALSSLCLGLFASWICFVQNFSEDLPTSLFAVLQMTGLFQSAYTLFIAYWSRKKVSAVFDSFQIFYDSSKCSNVVWVRDFEYS